MDKVSQKIGFIGLGIMGKPMALNLIKAGYNLAVFDINQLPVDELVSAGAIGLSSPRSVAEQSRVIITMLPNSPEVREVVLGNDGIIEGASPGTIVIDMSSIAPLASIEIAKKLKEQGIEMLDSPVSGGEPKAVAGTLSIMVGGEQKIFEEVEEILKSMGSSAVLVGGLGSGNTTKLANQIIVAMNIAGMSEAMVLARKCGVDPEKVFNAIRGGLAGSTVLEAKMPMILNGNFKPGFRIELHIKDLLNAHATAQDLGIPMPLTGIILEFMQALKIDGKGSNDHGGLIQYYEKMAGIEVRSREEL
jgi:2-hydroxy-3-oxopropionate reductase